MSVTLRLPVPISNQILFALGREEYALLSPSLELVHLAQGKVLYEASARMKYAYFLNSGMVSLLATTEGGRIIEVAAVGIEGVVGLPVVLGIETAPYRTVVQIKTRAMRIGAAALKREFNRGGQLQSLLLTYIHARLAQATQAVVCNHFHTVEQRFSRLLLTTQDRVQANQLLLTQQHISEILGTARTNVTMCASVLQQKKLIHCTRGQITIIDRKGLELSTCDCYRNTKEVGHTVLAA